MAQWTWQFSGLTHDTKVQDIEESLRHAIAAHHGAAESERDHKSKAVRHLAERLLAARLKALRARLSRLSEPGPKRAPDEHLQTLRSRAQELESHGTESILQEFGFHESARV